MRLVVSDYLPADDQPMMSGAMSEVKHVQISCLTPKTEKGMLLLSYVCSATKRGLDSLVLSHRVF